MKNIVAKLYFAITNLKGDQGQDLVEYALLIALIAFACTAGMGTLASSINQAFSAVAAELTIA